MALLRVNHLRTQDASEALLRGVKCAGERQNSPKYRTGHDNGNGRSEESPQKLPAAARRSRRARFCEPAVPTFLKKILLSPPLSVDFSLPVNHLRTQVASQVLLEGVARAGEGIKVSPAHPGCPRTTSEWGQPRR